MPRISYNDVPEAVTPGSSSVTSAAIVDGTIVAVDLADGGVTLPKLASLATDRLIGRVSSGTGVPEAVTFTDAAQALCDDADAATMRATLAVQDGPRYLPFSLHTGSVDATQGTVILGGSAKACDPTQHAPTGRTQTWTLILLASVTTGVTGTIELYDLVAGAVAATITVTSTTEGTAHTASITLPGTARRYKLRASCTGTTAADYLSVLGADIEQNWSA